MFLYLFVLLLSSIQPSYSLKIEITQGQVEPTPIAITDPTSADGTTIGSDIAAVVGSDLASSGLFRLIDKKAFIQDPISLQQEPRFTDWRLVNAQLLFAGQILSEGSHKIRINFRLFDVFSGTQLLGLSFTGDSTKWRKLAHMIADAIYKRVTGESGYFDTLIAFIDESGKGRARVRRLAVMDSDGHNPRYLTNGRHLVVTPRFSSTTLEIAYLSYASKVPSVYIYNIATGENKLLRQFGGMTFAPRFSTDGNSIVMSLEKEGLSAIYVMNIRTNQLRALTSHVSIDTSPCYSPDGQSIVFVSDRGGDDADNRDTKKVNIFVMDANGGNVRRISFGEGKYFQPVWSPRGDWIAFTKQYQGNFYIGVMRPDGSDERTIVTGYLVESPVWSANGRELMFTMEKGPQDSPHLYRVNLTGHNLHRVKTPHAASDGAWSRLLSEIPA